MLGNIMISAASMILSGVVLVGVSSFCDSLGKGQKKD